MDTEIWNEHQVPSVSGKSSPEAGGSREGSAWDGEFQYPVAQSSATLLLVTRAGCPLGELAPVPHRWEPRDSWCLRCHPTVRCELRGKC